MLSKEKVAIVRAIQMPEYFKEVMPVLDANLTDIWSDLQDNGKSLCPFHDERTPSFRWIEQTNTCYCYGCNTGGDIIHIHRKLMNNISFDDAVDFLYTHFIGDDADERTLKRMSISDEVSKADQLVYNHTVLDRVTPRNFDLAEDLSLLLRLGKLTGEQAVEYYKQRALRI